MSDNPSRQTAGLPDEAREREASHTEGIEKDPAAETGTETQGPAGE